jgi:Protein of unknown function (DUF3684)
LLTTALSRTTLRELLQNAADANATKVTIKFETRPSLTVPLPSVNDKSAHLKHVLQHHTLRRMMVTNNGQAFNENDWTRLKRIAEGNPDETKIGAFGVGFYSVFADCEEPFISSGKEAMAFYWKGNSLFTRRLQLPEGQGNGDTTFVLDYRSDNSPLPGLLTLCQFLSTSLTFVGLQEIELYLDDWNMLTLTKAPSPSVTVTVPKDIETRTKEQVMRVTAVDREIVQMNARWLNVVGWKTKAVSHTPSVSGRGGSDDGREAPSLRSFFSRLANAGASNAHTERIAREERLSQQAIVENLTGSSTAVVFLRITTATIRTSVSSSFSAELERATKKPPPKETKMAILTSSYDEETAANNPSPPPYSEALVGKAVDIFSSVLPSKSGRIFIGFPTHQTTGLGAHISAHSVIPTVERESIDLNARWVRTWNVEILRVAGIVTRIAYAGEMMEMKDNLTRLLSNSNKRVAGKEELAKVLPAAVHLYKQFTFEESTPSSQVGELVEESFWTCGKNASIDLLSTKGVLPSQSVRIASDEVGGFVEDIPVLAEELVKGAPGFFRRIQEYGLVHEITPGDVKKELSTKALTGKQLVEFLKWAGDKAISGQADRATIAQLMDVAVATLDHKGDGQQGEILSLSIVQHYVTASTLPGDLPLPPNTIPAFYTQSLPKSQLEALGWSELPITTWLRFICDQSTASRNSSIGGPGKDITLSPEFAAKVLHIISKQWDSLDAGSKGTVTALLQPRTVIPTKASGMKKPHEAYFPSVKVFPDLPILANLQGVKEKFLVALGVRKTVELGVVFQRLLSDEPITHTEDVKQKGNHVELIKYLASVQGDIPPADIEKLKKTPICSAEGDPVGAKIKRHTVSNLFEPLKELRSLQLPILQWPGEWRPGSPEGRFLRSLGLKAFPTVQEIIKIVMNSHAEKKGDLYEYALQYFIKNHHTNRYETFPGIGSTTLSWLPSIKADKKMVLSAPGECFTNEKASLLGFTILRKDLYIHAAKFGVQTDPPLAQCVDRLVRSPPKTEKEAREIFSYMATRLGELTTLLKASLSRSLIVPVDKLSRKTGITSSSSIRYISPQQCFLGESDTFGEIFDFVDFGQEANSFLLICGAKHEPTKAEIAQILVREPARLLGILGSPEKYLQLLKSLAESMDTIRKDRELARQMAFAPFLLASKRLSGKEAGKDSRNETNGGVFDDEFDEDDDNTIQQWQLAKASDIVVIDDHISYHLFQDHLLAAPLDDLLERFYQSLGTQLLSQAVMEEPVIGNNVEQPAAAEKIQKLVVERSKIFLASTATKEKIQHDSRWLEKHLKVQMVKSITLRRTLRIGRISHNERRTAAITRDTRGTTLWVISSHNNYFHISQALVPLMLRRPEPMQSIVLENILSEDLRVLKARGFNVDRILRQKAAEQRIAEAAREKQMLEDQAKLDEQEKAWKAQQFEREHSQKAIEAAREDTKGMPGAFGSDSPENTTPTPSDIAREVERAGSRPRGLFSNFTRRLGLGEGSNSQQQQQQHQHQQQQVQSNPFLGGSEGDAPPPYTATPKSTSGTGPQNPGQVTSPHQLQRSLMSAINAARPHDSRNLFSRPETSEVKEQSSYCDSKPSNDLSFFADSAPGVKIFLDNHMPSERKASFVQSNIKGLNAFANILVDCSNIFSLAKATVQIFYDTEGPTIAFNSSGSLFFNFRYFEQLHWDSAGGVNKKKDALVYWFVVFCHELAHNLVADHSSEHSFYT